MTERERMEFAFATRNVVESYQAKLKAEKIELEKAEILHNSALIRYDKAVEEYEFNISQTREICKERGFSEEEINALVAWRESE